MPLRSSARFRKQLSLTGTTNGSHINTQTKAHKGLTVKFSALRNVTSLISACELIASTDDQEVESSGITPGRLGMSVCVAGGNETPRLRVAGTKQ